METSIGSGFGQKKDYGLRFGISFPTGTKFLLAEGVINKQVGFNIMYLFGYQTVPYDQKSPFRLVFGMNYRFGFSEGN